MNSKFKEPLKILFNTILIPAVIVLVSISLLTTVMGTDSPLAVVDIDMTPWYVSSMYPTLYPGDLLLLSGKEDLKVGDIIVYRNPYKQPPYDKIVHRIIGISVDQHGVKRYVTKGDFNNYPDTYSPRKEDVIGKWIGVKIHIVGFVLLLAEAPPLVNTPLGRIPLGKLILIILLVVLLAMEILEAFEKKLKG
ncbi:MAG: signal peptidase I [Thermoproteota archaeon]|nr:signal peptidase I [Candidatus Brockarchaeota archaeon]